MANAIVIRTHGYNMLDIIDLVDGLSKRRHLDHVWFKIDIAKEVQHLQIELTKLLPTVQNDLEHTQDSDEE